MNELSLLRTNEGESMYVKTKSTVFNLHERTHIMGILNITPDSFSDGGKFIAIEEAITQAVKMEQEGADMIDVGGESTRPGHASVPAEEEMARVLPVIEAIKKEISVPISIDTYKAKTAEAAIQAGAEIINDIWGAKRDPEMAKVAATSGVPIILMHNSTHKKYTSLIDDLIADLKESIAIVKAAGVKDGNIIVDPGIGFAKEQIDNFTVLNKLEEIRSRLPYPLLLAASRKSFIGEVLDIPASERDNATGATTCLGITKGAQLIRVHDVKRHVELAKMMDAMLRGVGING